jgi:hypothetical protein
MSLYLTGCVLTVVVVVVGRDDASQTTDWLFCGNVGAVGVFSEILKMH